MARGLLSSCGSRALEVRQLSCPAACGILVPRPGIEPASPALESGFFTAGPPRKSLFFIFIYLFILAAPGLSCSMQDLSVAACRLLSCSMYAGSSSPTMYRSQAPCIGSVESYPLDHQGSPYFSNVKWNRG